MREPRTARRRSGGSTGAGARGDERRAEHRGAGFTPCAHARRATVARIGKPCPSRIPRERRCPRRRCMASDVGFSTHAGVRKQRMDARKASAISAKAWVCVLQCRRLDGTVLQAEGTRDRHAGRRTWSVPNFTRIREVEDLRRVRGDVPDGGGGPVARRTTAGDDAVVVVAVAAGQATGPDRSAGHP